MRRRSSRATWISRIVSGEAIVSVALTEPRGGSDAGNLALAARREGDGYILNGEKSSISMADQADASIVFARTGKAEDGPRGVSAFLVPMDEQRRHDLALQRHRQQGGRARLDLLRRRAKCRPTHRLAGEGMGFAQVMQGFDYSRALIGLQCAAAAQASLDETWTYVQERHAFGAPIAQYQGVTFPLAEGET